MVNFHNFFYPQTGKYVLHAEDLLFSNILPCIQWPMKHENFLNMFFKHAGSCNKLPVHVGRHWEGGFFQACKFDRKEYLPHTESKLSSLVLPCFVPKGSKAMILSNRKKCY